MRKKIFKGSFPNSLIEEIKTLTIGSTYVGKLEGRKIINMATESEKTYFTLLSIKHI
jgi:hypothetical protein